MVLLQTTLIVLHVLKYRVIHLMKSDGTGHCPGIGTQVFSVDSGIKEKLNI